MGVSSSQPILHDLASPTRLNLAGHDSTLTGSPVRRPRTSLIYALVAQLPSAYGGEHLAFGKLVKRTVEGWRAVGFEVVMVVDGACLCLSVSPAT